MLVAHFHGSRIEAQDAAPGESYRCPGCNAELVLKHGRIRTPHFAHKAETSCDWAKSETPQHRAAKLLVAEAFRNEGYSSSLECVVEALPNDRRADVLVTNSDEKRVAFELQHSTISLPEIEARAFAYAASGIAQIWIPFLRPLVLEKAVNTSPGTLLVEKYSAPPFVRWIHGLDAKHGMTMFDPSGDAFWCARLERHEMYQAPTSWHDEDGNEQYGGDFFKTSKRWKELTLKGPYTLNQLRIRLSKRRAFRTPRYNWPAGLVARLQPTAV